VSGAAPGPTLARNVDSHLSVAIRQEEGFASRGAELMPCAGSPQSLSRARSMASLLFNY
jgi:hypothetical protein